MPYLQMPDGRYFKYGDDVSFEDAAELSRKQFPKAWGEEVGGIRGMASRGIESLISSGQTAFEALTGSPEEAGKAGAARQKALGEKYKDEIGLEQLKQAYEEGGLWGGAKEVVRQVPLAIAEQAPNIGATIAGGRVGAAAGSVLGPWGAIGGGLLGAAAPSLIQQFGGNIERQVEAGKPVERGTALAGAIPQAGLDVVGNMIPFGRTILGKAFGPAMEKALAKGAGEAAERLAQESLKKSLAKGLGVGAIAEIPTEVAQQMIERAQAGLDLTSDDALAEYGNTAYQVGLLAPIGSVGRVVDRSAARQDIAEKKAAEARTAAEKAEQERLASPAYFDELAAQQAKIQEQLANMEYDLGRAKKKDAKARLQDRIDAKKNELADVQAQLAAHPLSPSAAAQAQTEQLAQLQAEETGIPAEFAQQQEEARLAAEEQAKQQRLAMGEGQQRAIAGFEPRGEFIPTPDVATQRAELDNQTKSLSAELAKINARIEAQQKELAAAAAAGDTTKAMDLMAQAEKDPTAAYKAEIEKQLEAAKAQAAELKKADPAEQLKALQKQFVKAGDEGNFEAIKILAPQIEALKQQVPAAPAAEKPQVQQKFFTGEGQPSLFATQAVGRRVDEVLEGAQKDLRAQVKQEKVKPEQQQSEAFMKELADQPVEPTAYRTLATQLGYPQKAPEPTGLGQRVLGRPSRAVSAEQANEDVAHALSYYTESMDELAGGYYLGGKNEKLAGPLNEMMPTKEDIIAKAEEAKKNVIDAALLKADNVRLDRGLPRLDDQAATKLASEINDIFVKHTSEGGMAPQMPGRISQAISQYAKPTIEEKRRALAGQPEEFALAPQTEETLAAKVAREEGAGKTNRSDTVSGQLQQALDTKPTGAIRTVLEEAKRIVDTGNAPNTLLDEAESQALRIINGKTPQMRNLYDETVVAKEGKVTEETQAHFPQFAQRGTIRQTADKFQKFLASPRMEFKRNEYLRMKQEVQEMRELMLKEMAAPVTAASKEETAKLLEQQSARIASIPAKAKRIMADRDKALKILRSAIYAVNKELSAAKADVLNRKLYTTSTRKFVWNDAQKEKALNRDLKTATAAKDKKAIAKANTALEQLKKDRQEGKTKGEWVGERAYFDVAEEWLADAKQALKNISDMSDILVSNIESAEQIQKDIAEKIEQVQQRPARFVKSRLEQLSAVKTQATSKEERAAQAKAEIAYKEAMDAKEKAKREFDIAQEKAAKTTTKVVSKVVEDRVSAEDIRYLKAMRTQATKDLKTATSSLKKTPNDPEFQANKADAETRLANINKQLANVERYGGQVKGQPVGATIPRRVIETVSPLSKASEKAEARAEAKKEAAAARIEKMQREREEAKAATKVTGAVPTSVVKLRDTIERINKRLSKIPEAGAKQTLAQQVERIALENKRKDLDEKLEAMLKSTERPMMSAAKYEKAGSNIIEPVKVTRGRKPSVKTQDKKLQEIETFSTEDLGAIAEAFQEAGLAVVPESDQFNFSEQTISDMNFAEGKTSTNTSTGMKGALLDYFQNPAEFDKHVTVFQTVDEAKKSEVGAKALSQASNPYRVQAFTDKDGHVYMIADAVVPGQELAVFLHEVGVHAGMERLIGAENMDILSSQINRWSKLGENTLEGSIARKAVERAEKSSSANKTEERIAYFVEEAVKAGVDPIAVQKTGSPFAQWFRTLIAAMKSALRKIGLARFEDLTAQNIVDLAYGAAKLKMTGRWHGTAADFRRFNHAFMGTGEGAQAFGWGTYLAERVGIAKGYWSRDVQEKNARKQIQIAGKEPQVFLQDLADSRKISTKGMALDQIDHYITSASRPRILAAPKYTPASVKAGITKYFEMDIATTEEIFAESAKTPFDVEFYKKSIDAATNLIEAVKALDESEFTISSPKAGKAVGALMYIDTAIHDNEYMDNDAYLRDQPEILAKIKTGIPKGMLNAVETMKNDSIDALTGREIYTALEQLLTDVDVEQADKKISEALDGIGVKGLKFADAFSRDTSSARRKLAKFEKRLADVDAAIAAGKPYTAPPSFIKARLRGALPDKQGKTYTGEELLEHRDTLKAAVDAARAAVSPITRNYIVFNDKNIVRVMSEMGAKQEEIKFSESVVDRMLRPSTGKFNSEFDAKYPGLATFGDKIVAKDKGILERVTANAGGLRFAIQFVDRFAGLQRIATTMKDKLAGFQMMYWLRIYDQRNNLTAEAASVGVPMLREETRAGGKKEFTIGRNENSSNLREIVQEVGKAIPDVGDANATMRMFSLYRMARRIKRLDSEGKDGLAIAMGRNLSPADRAEARKQFDAALKFGEGNVHFKAADEMYTRYTRALINFLAQSGAISRETANLLNKGGDYIGFYREKNGLIVDGEHNVTMGDLTTQPYLRELLGGDTAIVDFRTSSLQNTNLIISMALNNLATRNTAITLTQLGLAKASNKKAPAGDNVVKYKVHGEDWHIVVDPAEVQGQYGIPADLLVKGMRGVSTTLPAIVRLMQGPANLLRKGVTRMPTYAVRQVIRDSLNAYIAGGVDGKPVWNSVKQIKALMDNTSDIGRRIHEQGIGGGQVFSGAPDDVKRLMTDIMAGTNSWATTMAWLDKLAVNADTATRAAAYKSFRDKGMSDMEASLAALEMTNFSKRGISPSMAHMATMIPFFNAQIQGLNALWQAMAKTGIASERLDLKNKLLKRGALMMAMTVMYAAMMSDDEGYKNASADKKLANWLFYLPGIDTPLAIPIPFEVGFVFKAVPEALMLAASKDGADREVVDSLAKMAIGSIPGGSSFFIPQAAKPAIEVLTGKNLYDFSITEGTVGDIESARLKKLEPGQRKLPGTTGVAAALGDFLNVSPVKIDHFIRGYGGGMGAFLASAVGTVPEVLSGAKAVPQPEKKLNEVALIGGLFVATDGRGLIDRAFNKMEDAFKAKETYDDMIEKGDYRQAAEYAKRNATMINANTLAGQFRQKMGELAAERRAIIAAPGMTPAQKRKAIDEIRQREIYLSKQLNSIE